MTVLAHSIGCRDPLSDKMEELCHRICLETCILDGMCIITIKSDIKADRNTMGLPHRSDEKSGIDRVSSRRRRVVLVVGNGDRQRREDVEAQIGKETSRYVSFIRYL